MSGNAGVLILVVEDNPVTRKMLRVALQSGGFDVAEAHDGRSALAAVERGGISLVLQDLVLPDIHGLDLVVRLRALPGGAALPIVALSGFTGPTEEARVTSAGFNAVLVKPVEPSVLVEAIAGFLPRSRTPTPVGRERSVLVVDDDPVQLKLMRLHLGDLGFKVMTAGDAAEALRTAHERVPQVILSDVLMHDVDGFQLCFEVRHSPRLGAVPVVLMTAYYQTPADRDLAQRVGANALVLRTPGLKEIAPALLQALDEGAPPASEEPSDSVKLAHARAIVRQLERQVAVSAGLSRRAALQAAQLSLLGGIADALANRADFDSALRDVLAATLDAAAVSKGALFLRDGAREALRLRHAIGFSQPETAQLRDFFGHMPLLERIVEQKVPAAITVGEPGDGTGRELLERADVVFAEVTPLVSGGRGDGAILLGARRTDVTSEDSVAFARAIGGQIVKSLELEASFRRLAESEQRYRTLMESANDGISIQSRDGTIREVNRRMEEVLGLPRERIVGRRLRDFASAPPDAARGTSFEVTRADGTALLLEISDTEVDVTNERLVLSIARDTTEQARAQGQLLIADRMASVGMLAAGVAHEINNPLAAVTANLEIAAQQLERLAHHPEALPELLEIEDEVRDAREAAERVRAIVRDLRTFSRADEDQRSAVDVHQVLDSSLRLARNEVRHRAQVIKEYGRVPPVLANESRLGQVFLNLIVNAAQSIPEGHADRNQIRVGTAAGAGRTVTVTIADTGAGIPSDILKRLFTPFFTTKSHGMGTGLGLAICQRIITSLGGDISVISDVGKGSLFRVSLPAAAPEPEVAAADAAKPAAVARPGARRGRVLVVDDDPVVGKAIRRMLAAEHEIEMETDARRALARIAGGERFDVVLCDIMMPVVTGIELHAELKRVAPDQADRMVFLTGGAFTESARAFLDQVTNPRLDKPFPVQTLRALVNERLR